MLSIVQEACCIFVLIDRIVDFCQDDESVGKLAGQKFHVIDQNLGALKC